MSLKLTPNVRLVISAWVLAVLLLGCAASTGPVADRPDMLDLEPWSALDDAWGPYLAERQWGNPREGGWSLDFEAAIDRPYRWGDDGIGGITDQELTAAFAFAFYADGEPWLTERLRTALISNIEREWRRTGRFWEYYDGDTGEGIGADHQTGWTALVANLIAERYPTNVTTP